MDDAMTLVQEKLQGWYEALVQMLPNLVVAVLVLIAAWILARLARKLVNKGLGHVSHNKALSKLAAKTVAFTILAVGFFIALGILKLDKTVTSLLAGAGVIGLALGFAFQDITANFLSGIFLSTRRPFVTGDVVELAGHFGTVEAIDLRVTKLRSPEGKLIMVPNREVYENTMITYSDRGLQRVELSCGVSYAADLEQARRVALEAVAEVEGRDTSRDVEVFYTGFGGSSIDFVARFWVPYSRPVDSLRARNEAILNIKQAFDREGITIPFPIRTLDFGIEGGEKLSAMLSAGRESK